MLIRRKEELQRSNSLLPLEIKLIEKGENMPEIKHKTIEEIANHFPELPIIDLWYNPKMCWIKIKTYDQARNCFDVGMFSSEYWSAFQAIWRNLSFHYSGVAIEFEF